MVGCFLLAALVPLLSLCRKQLPGVSLELASEVAVSFCSHLSLPPPSLSLTKVKTFRFFAEVFVVSHLPPHQNYLFFPFFMPTTDFFHFRPPSAMHSDQTLFLFSFFSFFSCTQLSFFFAFTPWGFTRGDESSQRYFLQGKRVGVVGCFLLAALVPLLSLCRKQCCKLL